MFLVGPLVRGCSVTFTQGGFMPQDVAREISVDDLPKDDVDATLSTSISFIKGQGI